jgi:putative acetyltransferase
VRFVANDPCIRPICPADDPVVADIIRTVMTEHGAVGAGFAIVDPEVSSMSAAYAAARDPPARYFVVDEDGRVIGGAGFAPLAGGDPGVCELRKMYLRPSVRGAGLGRRLLAHVLADARAAGYTTCYLETMATMHRARALYESVGFERLCRAQGHTGHYGCDAWYARAL